MSIHLDLDNSRYPDQKAKMEAYLQTGVSPFLPENIVKDGQQTILKKGDFWYITKNRWPYAHTKYHYLIIANQYWTSLDQITPAAAVEVISLTRWLCQHFHVSGGAICLRFGDTNYSGGTVDHLHWQFIVPDLDAPDYDRIRFVVGKKPENLSH